MIVGTLRCRVGQKITDRTLGTIAAKAAEDNATMTPHRKTAAFSRGKAVSFVAGASYNQDHAGLPDSSACAED